MRTAGGRGDDAGCGSDEKSEFRAGRQNYDEPCEWVCGTMWSENPSLATFMKSILLLLLLVPSAMAQGGLMQATAPPTPPAIEYRDVSAASPVTTQSDFTGQTTLYSIGTPTEEEQYYLELINRARANPTAEGIRLATSTDPDVVAAIDQFGVDMNMMKSEFAALPVRPPLAMNEKLTNAARGHTQFQFDNAIQSHTGSGGSSPGTRVTAAGYSFGSVGESVFSFASSVFHGHAGFQIDWGPGDTGGMQLGRGHRMNNHSGTREVGIGVILGSNTVAGKTVGPQLVTQEFATALTDNQAFVTGVAYYDLNANGIFDPGEGIGGLTVNVNGATFHAVTTTTGGYAVPVPTIDATRAVTFTGLNANSGRDAIITDGANVKVDFIPRYTPPTPSGPDVASTLSATPYRFNSVIGATGYKGRSVANVNAADDGADNTSRVTVTKTGSYATISTTVKDSGTGSFHLANPDFGEQLITYNSAFHVKAGGSISIRSRLRGATSDQVARVQVSTNNGVTWENIYSQPGGTAEGTFTTRSFDLTNFVNKDIRVRFNYSVSTGFINISTGDGAGWFVDKVDFTNLVDVSTATVTTLPAGTTFAFTAAATGNFLLSVSPIISGKDFGFGVGKAVTASAVPPAVAEVYVEQTADTPLTDDGAAISFGTKAPNDDEVRSFTIRNDGTADLTGLALSVVGTHPADFVTSNLVTTTLAPAAETTFTVTFTAANSGDRTATLRIASNDADENPFDVQLAGTSTAPPSLSEITIEQPGGSALTSGGTVHFGTKMLNDDEVRTFTIRNDGTENLTGISLSVTGAHAADFTAGNLGATMLAPGNTTTFDVTFTAATQGARAATLRIASNDANENPFDVSLTGTASNAPLITLPPASIVRVDGAAAAFSVTATHPSLSPTYQWKKNNVNIKDATASTLNIPLTKPTDAGSYTVVVSAGGDSVTSNPALLVVCKPVSQLLPVAEGSTIKPTVTFTGTPTLTWTKTSGEPPETEVISVQANKTLILGPLSAATGSAVYKCMASITGGNTLEIGTFDVRVFNAKPQVTQNQVMPSPGAVGSAYFHQIKLNGGLNESPVSYSAKNLPTGLVLDKKLGTISGVPTVAKTFLKVSVTATNSQGSTTSGEQSIDINPLPPGVTGTFTGIVDRHATVNASLGGRVDFTIASTGAISGSLILGTAKFPFKGVIQIDTTLPIEPPTASISIARKGKPPATFQLTLDTATNSLAGGTKVTADGHDVAISGWRHTWTPTNLATTAPKLYTYALRPPAAMPDVPRGHGYGSFTLAKDGKLTTAGKLADGVSYTSATYAGPDGQILVYQPLYSSKGSIHGTLDIDPDDDGVMDDTGLDGEISWLCPPSKSRIYSGGFGPILLTAVGARHVVPAAPALILGITPGVHTAQLTFTEGGLAGAVIDPDVEEFRILAGNKVSLVNAVNPASVKLSLNATTGIFSGSFVLEDTELRTGTFSGKMLKRTASFAGILTDDGTGPAGLGHFLLEEMPKDAVPPAPATTPATSAKLSGSLRLERKP
jgi:uncharacterized protein YkwD